jgi:hypothetical protein
MSTSTGRETILMPSLAAGTFARPRSDQAFLDAVRPILVIDVDEALIDIGSRGQSEHTRPAPDPSGGLPARFPG